MKLLADANISRNIVNYLIKRGHDCVHAEEISSGLSDSYVLNMAAGEGRVILTADKDFGELVFRRLVPASGVILLRFHVRTEAERFTRFKNAWPRIENAVIGNFVVITNARIRRAPLPASGGP